MLSLMMLNAKILDEEKNHEDFGYFEALDMEIWKSLSFSKRNPVIFTFCFSLVLIKDSFDF